MKLVTIAILAELAFCMDICSIEGGFESVSLDKTEVRLWTKFHFIALRAKWDCDQLQGKFTESAQEKMIADQNTAQNAYEKANAKAAAIASIMGNYRYFAWNTFFCF